MESGIESCRFTGFYGWAERSNKRLSWQLLRSSYTASHLLWVVGGVARPDQYLHAFQEVLSDTGLMDMGYKGYPLTWDNGRLGDEFVEERLDKVVMSLTWQELFPCACLFHCLHSSSDHFSILLDTEGEEVVAMQRSYQFRFESMWTREEACRVIVHSSWDHMAGGDVGEVWFAKVAGCTKSLIDWSKSSFGNLKHQRRDIIAALERVSASSNEYDMESGRILKAKLAKVSLREEMMWKQRSR
ncbi:uncharacterized protein LOC131177002 [Hevea brasiliensis]|uniref:uncharacterized protein LOC131177002 n=1 Tax=Hevea brasiliensis TaxID=3981 RepID=UPI0025CC47AC|nr:uncharacterized protein LOC131177002 [Hevea brasiliensis]